MAIEQNPMGDAMMHAERAHAEYQRMSADCAKAITERDSFAQENALLRQDIDRQRAMYEEWREQMVIELEATRADRDRYAMFCKEVTVSLPLLQGLLNSQSRAMSDAISGAIEKSRTVAMSRPMLVTKQEDQSQTEEEIEASEAAQVGEMITALNPTEEERQRRRAGGRS